RGPGGPAGTKHCSRRSLRPSYPARPEFGLGEGFLQLATGCHGEFDEPTPRTGWLEGSARAQSAFLVIRHLTESACQNSLPNPFQDVSRRHSVCPHLALDQARGL